MELPDDFDTFCHGKRQMYTVVSGATWGMPGTWVPRVHSNCVCNEKAALMLRTLGDTYQYNTDYTLFDRAFRRLRRLGWEYCGARWSREQVVESYTGALRSRYETARLSLDEDGGLGKYDTELKAFLKGEKVVNKVKPRMIFPRSPRYNLELARYLKPFEHWLWGHLKGGRVGACSNLRVVAKGLNPSTRGKLIHKKFSQFQDPVVIEVDGKSFESHLDVHQLEQEHACYLNAYDNDPALRRLLAVQLKLKGKTSGGIKFERPGGRASGDFNTGMGNTLVMIATVATVMGAYSRWRRGVRWDILVDGDNAVLFLERDHSETLQRLFGPLARVLCGHTMELENVAYSMEQIRFGQCAPVEVDGSWRMVRDPFKVISHMTSNYKHLAEPRFSGRYLKGVAMCEASLAVGLPLLQHVTSALYESVRSVKDPSFDLYRDYVALGVKSFREPQVLQITAATRESFARAFGICATQQVALENTFVRKGRMDLRWGQGGCSPLSQYIHNGLDSWVDDDDCPPGAKTWDD